MHASTERIRKSGPLQTAVGDFAILLERPYVLSMNFFLHYFYQPTALSCRAVDGHQMYSGGSVVGKASTIGIEISPPFPNFQRGQKV